MKIIDKSNGYVLSNEEEKRILECISLMGDQASGPHRASSMQEKYAGGSDTSNAI